MDGKDVVITSGLLRALQGKGIEDIVELEYTDKKAVIRDFVVGWFGAYQSEVDIVIPQIKYLTNDSWENISCLAGRSGYPFLHSAGYANGTLYVLTIPENFSDLYNVPAEVLTRVKETLTKNLDIRLESRSMVSLFLYDNDTFIVESFLPESVDVRINVNKPDSKLLDLISGEELDGEAPPSRGFRFGGGGASNRRVFGMQIKPHSYRVFQFK
jgi:hypothetical protein